MSKNKSNGIDNLAALFGKDNETSTTPPKPEPKPAYIGKIELKYLDAALDKLTQPLHPNFIRAASADTLKVYRRIQGAVKLADEAKLSSSKLTAIAVGKAIKDDARTYVTFWTTLMSNVAFAGHMDCLNIERTLNPDQVESALDAMGDEHPFAPGDEPGFDKAAKTHLHVGCSGELEERGPDEDQAISTNFDEIYEATHSIQSWIDLAFIGFTPQQLDYWQCSPVPFCKRGADENYEPITDFDEYREFQTAQWKKKSRMVKVDDAAALMEVA